MKTKTFLLYVLFGLICSSCQKKHLPPPPELAIPKLDSAFEKVAATKEGKEYISDVSMTFLKTAKLDSCILQGDPTHQPISIYFDVNSVGKIGNITIKPNTLLSFCIKENVVQLSLPPPPMPEFLVRILLSFEDVESPQQREVK